MVCLSMCVDTCVCDSSVTIVLIGGKRMNLMEKRSITITISCSLNKMSQDGEKKKQNQNTETRKHIVFNISSVSEAERSFQFLKS